MSDKHQVDEQDARKTTTREARRRFLKVAGTAAVAIPVIETLTGAELITAKARAQSALEALMDGDMTGQIEGAG